MCFIDCSIVSFDFFFNTKIPEDYYSSYRVESGARGLAGSRIWFLQLQACPVTGAPTKVEVRHLKIPRGQQLGILLMAVL